MKRIIVLPMVVLLVALAALVGNVRVAHADNPPGYDIEVQMLYCINDDRPCNTIQSIRNSLYIQVEAVSFHPGAINGTPDAVDFTCGRAYIDKQGMFHDVAEHVFAGYESGVIRGNAKLEQAYTESSTRAEAQMVVWAHDNVTGDTAYVWGEMTTNNVTDLRVSGGYTVVLNGPIYDESQAGVKVVGHGTMVCNSYGRF